MQNLKLNDQLLTFTPQSREVHADNVRAGWWSDLATGETLIGVDERGRARRNVGELLMLVVSELAEAAEGHLGNLPDDKLPHREMIEVELADAKIRLLDIGGAYGLDYTRTALELLGVCAVPELREAGHMFNVMSALTVITQQVARAMESNRKKNAPDAVLPLRSGFEVGLTLALLLIHELGWTLDLDVDGAVAEKRAFNASREDHQVENRKKVGGKNY